MIKEELIKRSPLRILEKTLNGGLRAGQMGVLTARKGVGKTAGLVHIATDVLLRGQNVLHISFADDPRHIVSWYEQVFHEVAKAHKLDNAMDVHDEIIRRRLILHFKKADIEFAEIQAHIKQVETGLSVSPQIIIVDGYPFENASRETLEKWRSYAAEAHVAVWFSATTHHDHPDPDERGIPLPVKLFADFFEVIILLKPEKELIDLRLLKSPDEKQGATLRLKLDPKTLLISNHRA
jgi:hypothetical protein